MGRALIRSSQISRALQSVYTRRLLLPLIAAVLGLEIVGVAEGFAASLGHPVSGAYTSIPSQFVAIASVAFPILPYLSLVMLAGALVFGVIGPARHTGNRNNHKRLVFRRLILQDGGRVHGASYRYLNIADADIDRSIRLLLRHHSSFFDSWNLS